MAMFPARHGRGCREHPGKDRKASRDASPSCGCRPAYSALLRDGNGKQVRKPLGRNHGHAVRELAKLEQLADEGAFVAPTQIRFAEWADEWIASNRETKESTRYGYRVTAAKAKAAFGNKRVRDVNVSHIRALVASMYDEGLGGGATIAKHLRSLRTCFEVARERGHTATNPVTAFPKRERPKLSTRTKRAAPFLTDETPRLITPHSKATRSRRRSSASRSKPG